MGTTMTGNALNQWIEEEEALKLRLAEAKRNGEGMAYVTSEMVKDHSGLAIMLGILCGRYIAPSIGQTLGFLLVSVADGEVIFQGTPSPAGESNTSTETHTHPNLPNSHKVQKRRRGSG